MGRVKVVCLGVDELSLSLGDGESHGAWLCPGEANKPGPTWATPATAPNRPGPSRSSPRFFPRLRSQRAVRVLTALTRRQVQRGCSGKALVLWPDRAGRAPMPPSQRWWTEWGNKSDALVPFHLQIFSRHPACSPFFPPPGVSTGLRGQTLGCPRGHSLLTGLACPGGAAFLATA